MTSLTSENRITQKGLISIPTYFALNQTRPFHLYLQINLSNCRSDIFGQRTRLSNEMKCHIMQTSDCHMTVQPLFSPVNRVSVVSTWFIGAFKQTKMWRIAYCISSSSDHVWNVGGQWADCLYEWIHMLSTSHYFHSMFRKYVPCNTCSECATSPSKGAEQEALIGNSAPLASLLWYCSLRLRWRTMHFLFVDFYIHTLVHGTFSAFVVNGYHFFLFFHWWYITNRLG